MLNILELRKRLVRTAKARQGQFDKGLNMVPSSIRIAGGLSWASVQPLSFSFKKIKGKHQNTIQDAVCGCEREKQQILV